MLLVRLHGAVHQTDIPVDDADRLAGIAGVFHISFSNLNTLDEQPQQLRRQLVDGGILEQAQFGVGERKNGFILSPVLFLKTIKEKSVGLELPFPVFSTK